MTTATVIRRCAYCDAPLPEDVASGTKYCRGTLCSTRAKWQRRQGVLAEQAEQAEEATSEGVEPEPGPELARPCRCDPPPAVLDDGVCFKCGREYR